MRVLLLGGTAEARALAKTLHPRVDIVSSLAGRVPDPALPVGPVRVGGFGGVDGLRRFQHYQSEPLGGFTGWRPQMPVTQWWVTT